MSQSEPKTRRSSQGFGAQLIWHRILALAIVLMTSNGFMARAAESLKTRQVRVNDVDLTYVDQGTGAPVVFVHGSFSDFRFWEPQRQAIAQQHRFIALTQRYFGTTPWPDDGKHYGDKTMPPIWRLSCASSMLVQCIWWGSLTVELSLLWSYRNTPTLFAALRCWNLDLHRWRKVAPIPPMQTIRDDTILPLSLRRHTSTSFAAEDRDQFSRASLGLWLHTRTVRYIFALV